MHAASWLLNRRAAAVTAPGRRLQALATLTGLRRNSSIRTLQPERSDAAACGVWEERTVGPGTRATNHQEKQISHLVNGSRVRRSLCRLGDSAGYSATQSRIAHACIWTLLDILS